MLQSAPLQSAPVGGLADVITRAIYRLAGDIANALPRILAGIIFLLIAAAGIKLVKIVLGYSLDRAFPNEPKVYRQFIVVIVTLFLWFGVGLSFLSVVGLEQIAASLGSAAGFLALGVSYALSNVLADIVAGVYLLRDEDFMPDDKVDIGGTVGVVQSIELRKTRLTVNEGEDTMVRNNAEIEKKWTKLDDDVKVGDAFDDDPDDADDPDDSAAVDAQAAAVADEATDTAQKQAEAVTDETTGTVTQQVENEVDGDAFTDANVKKPE